MDGNLSLVQDQHGFRDRFPAIDAPPVGVAAERILDALGDADFSGALQVLIESLHANGATLGEWDGRREPRVVATAGAFAATSEQPEIFHFFREAARHRNDIATCTATIIDDQYACAVLTRRGRELLTLVVWSEEHEFRQLALLRMFLRLAEPLRAPRPRRIAKPRESEGDFPYGYVAGASRAMHELHRELRILARAEFPLLITGERGSGRETIARMTHAWARRSGPFVTLHGAAIPERLPVADGGTLLLDDIDELTPAIQARLVQALRTYDARVIAIASTDLEELMRTGRFRSDLYYRLAGAVVRVPPLRERRDDIPPLVQHFLETAARDIGQPVPAMTIRTLELLAQAQWPGNIRELEHELRHLVCHRAPGQTIDTSLLSESILLAVPPAASRSGFDLAVRVAEVERHTIRQALLRARGNRSVAARLLGLSRNGLALKMRRLSL
ncbi:MAG TPA: sigma 54-interacting transcriptional regulator [Thermoanaerobaculia bacterium]|nr:sigma 54-interacting transcriptional regulator [Thermoanaerobaculia bacterium]